VSTVIINPHLYERNRLAVTRAKVFWVEGRFHNQDGVISVKASVVLVRRLIDTLGAQARNVARIGIH
jgi:hypothetical protein